MKSQIPEDFILVPLLKFGILWHAAGPWNRTLFIIQDIEDFGSVLDKVSSEVLYLNVDYDMVIDNFHNGGRV
jgi:hypothetical protein